MASSYKFLTVPGESLKCLICSEIASDPKQHVDCGKLFCSECLEKYENKPCPNCRAGNPQYFPDRRGQREIQSLQVRCNNVEGGCDWVGTVGTLKDHVAVCGFTLLSCPNKCNVEGEGSLLMRKDLDNHLKTSCPNREYQCVYCGEKGTYASITEEHDSACIKKVVLCPNTECTSTMERGLTRKHAQTVCNYTEVACKYVSIGCSVKKMRMDMKQHEEDDQSHFPIALEKIMKFANTISLQNAAMSSLQNAVSSLEGTTSSLEDTTSSLVGTTSLLKKKVYSEKAVTFNLPRYSKKKEDDVIFYSEPSYTSPGGYKMRIEVYPNGHGEGTHVTVYSQLLEGPNDGNLSWPFLGTVTVELLNQLANNKHHCKKLSFETIDNARVDDSKGYDKFLPHTKLSHDHIRKIQYLMKDTLYFRVTVEVDHHKPWLDCTLLIKRCHI